MTKTIIEKIEEKTSELHSTTSTIVHEVVMFQWKSGRQALNKFKKIEITGFGKFSLRPKEVVKSITKCERMYESLEKQLLLLEEREKKRETIQKKLSSLLDEIEFLKTKL